MSLNVFALVIAASLLQAWWNFHLKKVQVDKAAFLMVGWFIFGLISTPLSLFFIDKPFDPSWWHFVLATGMIQGLYLIALSTAYTLADVSLIFPLARGLSIALTTVALVLFVGYPIDGTGFCGIGFIFVGAMTLAFRHFSSQQSRVAMSLAVVIGILISSYSVLDSFGAQKIPIIFYVCVMNVVAPVFAFPWLYNIKKNHFVYVWKNHLGLSVLVALAGSVPYLIVIWAYTMAPPHYVLALREISIVITSALGIYYLKEPINRQKVIGILFILLGILLLKLATP